MKAPLDRHEIGGENVFQKVLTEVHHNTEKYGQKRLQKRQTTAAYLGRKMRMVPEGSGLVRDREIVTGRSVFNVISKFLLRETHRKDSSGMIGH